PLGEIAELAAKRPDDLHQPREANAVGAALVFLHLLEGDADPAGQLALRDAGRASAVADAAADSHVQMVWRVVRHETLPIRHLRKAGGKSHLRAKAPGTDDQTPRSATRRRCGSGQG